MFLSVGKGLFALIVISAISQLGGCASIQAQARGQLADIAVQLELVEFEQSSSLTWYGPDNRQASERLSGSNLLVFIGGDGLPWVDGGMRIASDPTAGDKTIWSLMAPLSSQSEVAFLARPCYYLSLLPPECTPALWTSARYGQAVVDQLYDALVTMQQQYQPDSISLIGFSGGGTLAVLLAAENQRRQDTPGHALRVKSVVSIAANLPVVAWTTQQRYLPLTQSLDASEFLPLSIPHLILLGEADRVVPLQTYSAELMAKLEADPKTTVEVIPDQGHACCWQTAAPRLIQFLE